MVSICYFDFINRVTRRNGTPASIGGFFSQGRHWPLSYQEDGDAYREH